MHMDRVLFRIPRMPLAAALTPAEGTGAAEEPPPELGPPPGIVIGAARLPDTEFVGSPSIVILPDGACLASHDFFGKKGDWLNSTRVFNSTDRGLTWTRVAHVRGQFWSSLFVHRGAVYLFGTSRKHGDVVIRRSTDSGRTWNTPLDAKTGRLFLGKYHCAPVPLVVHGGRIWRAFEEIVNDLDWPRHHAALVISAPEDADLLDAANWRRTNGIVFDPAWAPGRRPGWLEGNVVVTPEGGLANILRTNTEVGPDAEFPLKGGAAGIPRFELAARIEVPANGETITFDPNKGFFHFPGSQSKFTIRFDPVTRRYWSLVNKITNQHHGRDSSSCPLRQRNVLALTSSADLRQWQEHAKVLRWREGAQLTIRGRVAFQYPDWQFDGDDLIVASRTAWNGQNYHNANYLTFHRIRNFRALTMADSAPDLAAGAS